MTKKRSMILCVLNKSGLYLTAGVICGFLMGQMNHLILLNQINYRPISETYSENVNDRVGNKSQNLPTDFLKEKSLLLIGVMTAKLYLHDRVVAINKTWGRNVPGKIRIIYFTSKNSIHDTNVDGIDVVELEGVDDSYPPQKKSFLMLKYMHDHYIDDFKFFMRADDDIYVRTDELIAFLNSVDSDKILFIGQAGLGNKKEFGHLYLKKDNENFCMGGPGILLSRQTLMKLVPHIGTCLRNLYTRHEDVELGRCIGRHVGVSCTWAYEMQKIFYNNYDEPQGSFTSSLNRRTINQAITLHPFKNSSYIYRAHHYFLTRNSNSLRNKMAKLSRDIKKLNYLLGQDYEDDNVDSGPEGYSELSDPFVPKEENEMIDWEHATANHIHSSLYPNPRRKIECYLKYAINDITDQLIDKWNDKKHERYPIIDAKQLLHAYYRLDPQYGSQYILHLLLEKKISTNSGTNAKVQRRQTFEKLVHGSQPFLHPIVKIEDLGDTDDYKGGGVFDEKLKTCVHFLLPLSGRHKTFLQFIDNFQKAFLESKENVSLVIILFKDDQNSDEGNDNTVMYLESLKLKYSSIPISYHILQGQFSRGRALSVGSSYLHDDDLLLFIDVDVLISRDVLFRVRLNTIPGQQVYYPIVFSQYNPANICLGSSGCHSKDSSCHDDSKKCHTAAHNISVDDPDLNANVGYWREFGFGVVSTFKKDFVRVGGFNLSIQGWGKEDVDLVDRYIHYGINIFRSVDTGLVHIYHPIICDDKLEPSQYRMCLGSMSSSFASVENMARYVWRRAAVFKL